MQLQTRYMHMPREAVEVKSVLILGMCLLYMISFFVHIRLFTLLLCLLSVTVFLLSLSDAKPVPRFFSICMFVVGVLLNFVKGNGIVGTVNGILTNLPLLWLVLLVPLVSIPLKMAGYFSSIHFFLK
ncbi:hypothetical protein [Effusibacillus dendaii]|uniref:Uncharacterized protein n=1 Tax=Effusibacillus dendaii TaxID=2743772 RepID=A0A7I8DI31_9BACL|nr:hypothetical protein [Effusibacillus dendaii]BCJ88300.1 hypothetical protein skT53_32850 [Effusibacillus dendaii]